MAPGRGAAASARHRQQCGGRRGGGGAAASARARRVLARPACAGPTCAAGAPGGAHPPARAPSARGPPTPSLALLTATARVALRNGTRARALEPRQRDALPSFAEEAARELAPLDGDDLADLDEEEEEDARKKDDEGYTLISSSNFDDEAGNTRMFRYENQATYSGKSLYDAIRIEPDGTTRAVTIRRRDLIRRTGIAPRDLRRIDPTLTLTRTSPCLIAREDVLLVNLGGLRLVVSEDHAILFEPTTNASVRFLEGITQRLATLRRLESLPSYARGDLSVPVPFELEVVEAALIMATARLDNKLLRVAERTDSLVARIAGPEGIVNPITANMLEELRRVKIQLVQLESRAENLKEAVLVVLDEDEDAREILVSRTVEDRKQKEVAAAAMLQAMKEAARDAPAGTLLDPAAYDIGSAAAATAAAAAAAAAPEGGAEEETEEARREREEGETEMCEELLEYYLQRFETVHSEAERLLESARDLEESISVSLASRRLSVNQLELRLSIATFAVANGALVTGIFGMNLRSTLEMSVTTFYGVCAVIIVGCLAVNWWLTTWTRRRKIL